MKKVLLALAMFVSVGHAAEVKAHVLLEQAMRNDEVVGGAIKRATALGESCAITVISIKHEASGGEDFKARVDCSVEGDEYIGGGIVLMLQVEGRAFDSFLGEYTVRVDHAG